jgi:hypothetical protein
MMAMTDTTQERSSNVTKMSAMDARDRVTDDEFVAMTPADFNRVRGYDPLTRTYTDVPPEPLPTQQELAVLYKRWAFRKKHG